MSLCDNKLNISTKHIEYIDYPGLNGVSFPEYERAVSLAGLAVQAQYMLMSPPYNIPEMYAVQLASPFAKAMMAHFAGNETISAEANAEIQFVSGFSQDLGNILYGLYTDLEPLDNELVVDLK